ncbi:glycosyl transferase group 1 [Thermosediminibacter oceani DSM 16646]|uniref:Glycosyl transferase group 1 n=1 Tax=Thermosediminibacter oceani (strain ATCC BAA-1034 / DSM 16646 / JW/IW-1228P) TaxID=555079 RepID=D9S1K8_THEOJ|nr:glycosyl transferase group 1 [Thermosediminibacter oceani DSM 16646]
MGLRLLIYGINYTPEPTGTGKYTGEMAAWLAARGHQVDAIVGLPHYPSWEVDPAYQDKGFHTEIIEGVRVLRVPHFVPSPERIGAIERIRLESSFSLKALRYWLLFLLQNNSYDAVIAICPPMQVGVYPWLYRLFRGVPWIFHIQDLQVDVAVRLGLLNGKLSKVLYTVENFLLRRATRVSTITEAMRRRIIAKGVPEKNTWLFPNWSDITFIRPMPRNNAFRQELRVAEDQILFMYAGNMGEKQGLELVLQAAEHLRYYSQLRFVLVGAGVAKQRLEKMAEEMKLTNVTFLPVQPLERLPEMLAAADVHLVVQKSEAADLVMPSKLTNILAAGRPVVATADSGTALHDVLTSYQAGIVTPPGDLKAFIDALQLLAESAILREQMGRNARLYAERYLDKERILKDFEDKLITLVREVRKR